jgi:hypothetical protein
MRLTMFKLVFSQALHYRCNKGGIWGAYLALGLLNLLLLIDVAIFFATGKTKPTAIFGLVILATQVALIWGLISKIVPLIVTPNHARLVPGLRRGVMGTMVVSWSFLVLFFGLTGGYLFESFARAGGLTAVMLGGLALLSIGRWEGFFPYMLGILIALERVKLHGIAQLTSTTMLVGIGLLTSAYAFFRMFPSGDRHWRSMDKLEKQQLKLSGQVQQPGTRRFSIWGWAYGKVLEQDCQQPEADRGKLLWHALGPSAHWSAPVLACLALQTCVALGLWLLPKFGLSVNFWQGFALGISAAAVLFGQFWHLQQISVRMHATRGEQQLVMLTPRIPQNEALKHLVVRDALWQSAGMFALALLTTLFVSVIADDPPATTQTRLLQVSLTVLASVGVLRALTRKENPGSVWPSIVVLLQMLAVGGVFAIAYPALSVSMAQPWIVLAAGSFVVAGVLLWRDVQKVIHGPAVWPLASA